MRSLIQNSWKYQGLVSNYLRCNFSTVTSVAETVSVNKNYANKDSFTNTNQEQPVKEVVQRSMKIDRLNYTPHEYWVTQGQGMERPFTGDKWFEKDVGYYHCTVCDNRLFTWDQKFSTPNGMASFWNHEKNAIKVSDTTIQENYVNLESTPSQINPNAKKQRACCAKCHSNLGLVFIDGPPPTFKRFSINSSAIKFIKKENWENPHFASRKRKFKLSTEQEIERKRALYNAQKEGVVSQN